MDEASNVRMEPAAELEGDSAEYDGGGEVCEASSWWHGGYEATGEAVPINWDEGAFLEVEFHLADGYGIVHVEKVQLGKPGGHGNFFMGTVITAELEDWAPRRGQKEVLFHACAGHPDRCKAKTTRFPGAVHHLAGARQLSEAYVLPAQDPNEEGTEAPGAAWFHEAAYRNQIGAFIEYRTSMDGSGPQRHSLGPLGLAGPGGGLYDDPADRHPGYIAGLLGGTSATNLGEKALPISRDAGTGSAAAGKSQRSGGENPGLQPLEDRRRALTDEHLMHPPPRGAENGVPDFGSRLGTLRKQLEGRGPHRSRRGEREARDAEAGLRK